MPKDVSNKSDPSCNPLALTLTRNGLLGQRSDITFKLSRSKEGGGEFFNTRLNFKVDLLRKSRVETGLNVVNTGDEVKAEAEAFATATITFREDAKHFEPTDDALDVETQGCRTAIVKDRKLLELRNISCYSQLRVELTFPTGLMRTHLSTRALTRGGSM